VTAWTLLAVLAFRAETFELRVPGPPDSPARAVVVGVPLPRDRPAGRRVTVVDARGARVPSFRRPAFPGGAGGLRWSHVEFVGRPGKYRVRFDRSRSRSGREVPRGDPRVARAALTYRMSRETGPFPADVRVDGVPVLEPHGIGLAVRGTGLDSSGRPAGSLHAEHDGVAWTGYVASGITGSGEEALHWRVRTRVFPAERRFGFSVVVDPKGRLLSGGAGPPGVLVLRVRPRLRGTVAVRAAGRSAELGPEQEIAFGVSAAAEAWRTLDGRPDPVAEAPRGFAAVTTRGLRLEVELPRFAERRPKAVRITREAIEIELLDLGRWKAGAVRRFDVWLRFGDPRDPPGPLGPSPVVALLSPDAYRRHALARPLVPAGRLERAFDGVARRVIDLELEERRRRDVFGEWDYGDWPFFEGFGNLEFDTGYGWLLHVYRTADARALRLALDALRHWVDVDRVHSGGPLADQGLPRMHGKAHGSRVDLGHVWLDGILHGYLVTGDRFFAEAFHEAGAALVRRIEREGEERMRRERNAGWGLHALAAVVDARADPRAVASLVRLAGEVERALADGDGLPRLERDPRDPSRFRIAPWVTAGVLLTGLARAADRLDETALRLALGRSARALVREALDPRRPGIRASLGVDAASGEVVARGPLLLGDYAVFAAAGLAEAARVTGDRELARRARRLLAEALDDLARRRPKLDGRARSRILRNGPLALASLAGR